MTTSICTRAHQLAEQVMCVWACVCGARIAGVSPEACFRNALGTCVIVSVDEYIQACCLVSGGGSGGDAVLTRREESDRARTAGLGFVGLGLGPLWAFGRGPPLLRIMHAPSAGS